MQMARLAMSSPKALIQEVIRLPLKSLFWKGIRYRNLRKAVLIFSILLALQLRYSKRARSYAVRITMVMGFSVTFFGFIITLVLFGIKLKLHTKHHHDRLERQRTSQIGFGNDVAAALKDE